MSIKLGDGVAINKPISQDEINDVISKTIKSKKLNKNEIELINIATEIVLEILQKATLIKIK